MIKKLVNHGNSSGLVIEKAILNLLNITQKTPLEITTDGKNIIISPVRESGRRKIFKAALSKVNQRQGKTFRILAK